MLVSLLGIGYYFKFKSSPTLTNNSNSTEDVSTFIKLFKDNIDPTNPTGADRSKWVIDYKHIIPLIGKIYVTKGSQINFPTIKKTFDSYFNSLGFSKSSFNSYQKNLISNDDDVQLGYEKGDLKCLINYTYYQGVDYYCGRLDQDQQKLQEELLADFLITSPGIIKRLNIVGEDAVVLYEVDKVMGNFAKGRDNEYKKGFYLPSGGGWIAVKENGRWTLISDGQDAPDCSIMDKYSIPKKIYNNCWILGTSNKDSTLRFKD